MAANITLVIAATNDNAVNEQVYHEAIAFSIIANVVEQPALCTYIMPAYWSLTYDYCLIKFR